MSKYSLTKNNKNITGKTVLLLAFFIFITPKLARAAQASFSWNADPTVDGYKLYFGSGTTCGDSSTCQFDGLSSTKGASPITISDPNQTSYTLDGLVEGSWCFRLAAYNSVGESTPTATITKALDTLTPSISITDPTTSANYTTTNSSLDISGTASDNLCIQSITWTNDRGGSGTASGSISWSQSGIALLAGDNVITVTVNDYAANSASANLTVNYIAPPTDTEDPVITITGPTSSGTYNTNNSQLSLSGTSSDNVGVGSITWTNNRGGGGTASGTTNWSAAGITLYDGLNIITATATDTSANTSTDVLSVTFTLPQGTYTKEFGDAANSDHPGTCLDTYTNLGSGGSVNYSSEAYLSAWTAGVPANRIIIKWDLGAIPPSAIIQNATLYLNLATMEFGTGGDMDYEISAHKLINHNPAINSCTWNTYDGTNPWTGGANGAAQDMDPAEDLQTIDKTLDEYKTWTITGMVADWTADQSQNFGMIMDADDTAAYDSHRRFYSSDHTVASQRPKLIITYSTGCTPSGSPENVCNGIDDDCDGQVDEDYPVTATACGTGACVSSGQLTCQNGIEADTCQAGTPTVETCDGIDNDCDGQTDEDFPGGCDSSPPAGSISINNGNPLTNSTQVTVTNSVTDDSGVVAACLISEIPITPPPSANDPLWETPVPSPYIYQFSNTADGAKTIYAWFKDGAGNVSTEISDVITLDTIPPQGTVTIKLPGIPIGAVAYWNFDEGSGGTAFDKTASANDMTINSASWATGIMGNALNFDGTNNGVEAPNHSSLNPTNAITTEAWIKTVPTSNNQYILNRDKGEDYQMTIVDSLGVRFWVRTTGGVAYTHGGTIPDDTWTHVVGTYDGSVIKVYVNGVEVGSDSSVSGTLTYPSPGPLRIGRRGDSKAFYTGDIDEVVIYDRALSASEVQDRYNLTIPPTSPQGSVVYWKLDEGSGGTASDETANANDGTINGASWTTGIKGNALNFDGTDDSVEVANHASLNPTDAVTIEAWIKTEPTSSNQYIVARERRENYQMTIVDGYDLRFWVWTTGGIAYTYGGTIPDNTWTHVVGTYDGSVIKIYVNGVEVGRDNSVSGTIVYSSPGPLQIGKRVDNIGFYAGDIDEIVIYSKALSASEVQDRYREGGVSDGTPPIFSGLESATNAQNSKAVDLSWSVASDPSTPITYNIYFSTSSGTQNFSIPYNTTQNTSYRVTGLTNNQTYYFVVRAEDASNNEEQNTVELSSIATIPLGSVAYWNFDEGNGGTTSDETANANDGTINGASWTTSGRSGNALDFNGSSDYVDIADDTSLDPTSKITIEAWVNPNTAGGGNYGRIISKYGPSSGWDLFLGDNHGTKLGLKINGKNLWSEAGSLVGAWHHVVVVYESGVGAKFYVDGVLAGTDSNYTGPIRSNNYSVQIGKWPTASSRYFDGLIDEVVIYNKALNATEVQDRYNSF